MHIGRFATALMAVVMQTATLAATTRDSLTVSPQRVVLDGPEATQQLIVTQLVEDGRIDQTRDAEYRIEDTSIASVTMTGQVIPHREGETNLIVRLAERSVQIPVVVQGLTDPIPVSFRHEVLPILSKSGCNSGGCHGKAEGQNGFKLSVFGFDADFDHGALVKEGRGRRVFISAPEHSLLLRKATGEAPHGGGARMAPDSTWYRRLTRWIGDGAEMDEEGSPQITGIEVEPAGIVMSPNATQQLRVTAVSSDGRRRCVTSEAEYASNSDEIASADHDGLISVSDIPGEAAILVRYMGQVGLCRVTLPQPDTSFTRPQEHNFVDAAVWDKLEQLGLQPGEIADDATFFRRASLDVIGTLPTALEVRKFLEDESGDKRSRAIRELLTRPEYATYWAMRWSDILRIDKSIVTSQGAVGMTRWLRRQFRENKPYDEFAREIVTARGNTLSESPAAFYQVHKDPKMLGDSISQVFLGVRIGCAECHHHPFERWSQHDYYAFAGFFTGVGRGSSPTGGQKIFPQPGTELTHPRTEETVVPAGLGADPAQLDGITDRRVPLADWMTSPENPFFARMIVNRLWAHYFGRGLVEPIDDMRATNPATNEPLLDALAQHLIDVDYDLRELTATMLTSRTYQLQSLPNKSNAADEQNFSHAIWKPLPAEVLLDAICQATEVPEEFNGWPEGSRAIEVWDNRMPSYFFRIFGRPQRVSVCECERGNEPSIAQALHLMNSPESVRKIRHRDGIARRLAESDVSRSQVTDELYLSVLSRLPSNQEKEVLLQAFDAAEGNRRQAIEDILWTLLNTREFVYNH